MRVTEVLILAVQFAVVSGTLTVLTGKEVADRSHRKSRELVCVSDDDGAGLTWNCDLNCNQSSVIAFQNPNELRSRSLLDCELNQNGSCTSSWSTDGWSLTCSMVTPMGPVLDRRWEGFTETQERYVDLFRRYVQSFVVSIRGSGYVKLEICEVTDHNIQFCYWIRLSGSVGTSSSLLIRPVRVSRQYITLFPQDSGNQKYFKPTVFPLEWKTFVVTFNELTRNISVYDSEKMILTLVNSKIPLAKPDTRHYLHLGDNDKPKARYRLHNYDFLHTTNKDAVLRSPKLSVNTTNFCVEMAVGLCAECNLKLTLENPSTKKDVHTLEEIEGFPTVHGFPAWRYVRVNKSISLRNSTVQLRMLTILREETYNPLWAVANVRACPPADSIRKGRLKTTEGAICQKLFNNESTVLNSSSPAISNMKFDDSDCQLGKVGPHCSISCTEDLQLEEDCRNAKICDEPGCSCSPGYTGSRCDERCPPSQYGNDCNKTCDFCLNDDCDFRTGECKSGCKQSKGFEVQPLSKNNSEPENLRLEVYPQGLVDVSWLPSWKVANSSPIRKFILSIRTMCSNLRTKATRSSISISIENSVKEYEDRLYLLPSTTYDISIFAETVEGLLSLKKFGRLHTPLSSAFEKELSLKMRTDSFIVLYIPVVLNDTQYSEMHVLVKGSQPCDQSVQASRELADKAEIDYNDNDTVWHVATFPTNEFVDKPFVLGDNKSYGYAVNCPLKPLETYVITVLVTEEVSPNVTVLLAKSSVHVGEGPKQSTWLENNTVHFYGVTILVLILAVAAVYLYYRKKMEQPAHKNFRENNPLISDRNSTSYREPPFYTPPKKLEEFEGYVKEAIEERLLDKQYNTLSGVQNKPSDHGMLPQNCPKNRFSDLIVYDENRVILNKLPDKSHSDYINASYIQGFKEMRYIATQGPTLATVEDFWRMIWQEESLIICMMADVIGTGKSECYQYWPNVGEHMKYGNIVVENAEQTVYADYTFRIFYLTCGEQRRKIEQLHYTAWPYHGVPMSSHSVVKYLKKLKTTSPGKGPIVVHGVAGGGRTGTIILCDICLRRAEIEGMIDVFDTAMSIRSQRANMIDNKQQYLFAHFTLVEYLFLTEKPLPCDDRLTEQINERKKHLRDQMASIEKAIWQDRALRPADRQTVLSRCNLKKNRFPNLAPANIGRVCLKRYPPTDENSDYISAVYVDGVKMQNQYIATQSPMPGTLRDFWRMVAENKIELIVALQPPDPNDKTCCPIVPSLEFEPPDISIKTKERTTHEYYKLEKITLLNNMVNPPTELQVTIITSTEWKPGKNQARPSSIKLMTLWQATEKINRGDGPSVVVCYDGITGCGLYLALNIMLDIMIMEDECDVCWASRVVRRCNEHFVKSEEEMEYLYDAAIKYNKIYKITDSESNASDQLYTVT